ncbi:MAG: T9SS type A sorting domain-containing protein [Phycisphaerales bacterium]|nr:T9SS type A sorting domain-containing protein [Phycisphaerales bacterium]
MKLYLMAFAFWVLYLPDVDAQFAPQVGISGSIGIHKTSPLFKSWANDCSVRRGWLNIADKISGKPVLGDSTDVLGFADGNVVSLGDSGVATIKFVQAIYNGVGPDFSVFENGFQNPDNIEEAFLELAFVEVSSDGEHYYRFPATSNTTTTTQVKGTGDYMNARYINNLAGKYITQYGTPFDLDDLKDVSGLNLNYITSIRIIDVVGSVAAYQSFDHLGQIINDPYPTPFPTGGFDLDAVGAINVLGDVINAVHLSEASIFPNPANDKLYITIPDAIADNAEIMLSDCMGKIVLRQKALKRNELIMSSLAQGLYFIHLSQTSSTQCIGKCSKI